jgi:hypothetical protein
MSNNFLLKKEIDGLKQDILSKEAAVEAYKYAYELELLNGLGEEIKKELKNPSKPSWWNGMKIKYARWKKIREEKRKAKRFKKEMINNQDLIL